MKNPFKTEEPGETPAPPLNFRPSRESYGYANTMSRVEMTLGSLVVLNDIFRSLSPDTPIVSTRIGAGVGGWVVQIHLGDPEDALRLADVLGFPYLPETYGPSTHHHWKGAYRTWPIVLTAVS